MISLGYAGILAIGLVACAESKDDNLPNPKPSTTTSTTQNQGGGGTGGGVGGENSGGQGETGGVGGGTSASTGTDSESGTDTAALDIACTGDKAFEATGMSFVFPTPPALGVALGMLTYDPSTHPITIVLLAEQEMVTASAADSGKFVVNPPAGTVSIAHGGFSTDSPQTSGLLRLVDPKDGTPIDIALENLTFSATTQAGCSYANVVLEAVIPATQGEVLLPVGSSTKALGQLTDCPNEGCGNQGGQGAGAGGWLVRAFFQAQTTSFDFASMGPSK